MPTTKEYALLTIAEGSIDPDTRIANGEITQDEIERFMVDIQSEEFDAPIDPEAVPAVCVDGRGLRIGPNAAGGTFTLVVADALTSQSYRQPGEKAPAHAVRLFTELTKAGKKIGGHDDDHAKGNNCGCGAEDKLDNSEDENGPSILGYIERRGDDIKAVLESPLIGLTISDELHESIVSRSKELRQERYATAGCDLKKATLEVAGEEAIEPLTGVHNEVALRIRTKAGATIDRPKLREKYGDRLEVFELDLPNLKSGVEAISLSNEEADRKFIAALYYNVATASVLAGPSLRVIVL